MVNVAVKSWIIVALLQFLTKVISKHIDGDVHGGNSDDPRQQYGAQKKAKPPSLQNENNILLNALTLDSHNDQVNHKQISLPDIYSVYVRVDRSTDITQLNRQTQIQHALAEVLHASPKDVHLGKIKPKDRSVQTFLVNRNAASPDSGSLMRAEDVETAIASNSLPLSNAQVQEVYTQEEMSTDNGTESILQHPYFLFIMGGVILIVVGISILSLVWFYRRQCQSKASDTSSSPARSSPSPPAHISQQICLYPPAKPGVNGAVLIQPDITQIHTNKSCGECGTPIHTPPLHKKKGLLERRGSNASLTLDLPPSTLDSKPKWGSPPRESSAEEYLLSAGNRMSRKQLRNCLQNPQVLHEEFWEIPMNHPTRVTVHGSGTKNRYRTIIPNEHSRVKMKEIDGDPLSTYINANYIKGYAGESKAFIASQGPMAHTIDDFWRMVWEEKVPLIVMITKLKKKKVPTATLR